MRRAIVVLYILLAQPALALDTCSEASGIARTECLEKRLDLADKVLRTLTVKVIANIQASEFIPAKEREKFEADLRESHDLFLKHARKECKDVVPYLWWGGSGGGVDGAISSCLLGKVASRIKELERLYPVKVGK
jgi:uncharacterized protein YecT (DUF1311 family)